MYSADLRVQRCLAIATVVKVLSKDNFVRLISPCV